MEILTRLRPIVRREGDVVTLCIDERFRMMESRLNASLATIAENLGARKVRVHWGEYREEQKLGEHDIAVRVIFSDENLENTLRMMFSGAETIALDFETSSVDALTCDVVGVGLTSLEKGATCYIPVAHTDCNANFAAEEVFRCLGLLLGPARFVVHNLAFEAKILGRHGVRFDHLLLRDTMIYSYILNSSKKKGLKAVVADKYSIKMTTYDDVSKSYKNFADVPVDQAAKYCGADTYWTATLLRDFEKEMQSSPELIRLVDLDHRVALACSYMESVGVVVDDVRLAEFGKSLAERCDKMSAEMRQIVGRDEFNPSSSKQVKEYLFGELQLSTEGCTQKKTKKLSSDQATLEHLVDRGDKHPLIETLQQYRKTSKLLTTYTTKIIERINPTTRRLHTSLMYTGTETGRFASSAPNLQNLPASGDGKEVRCCLVPPTGPMEVRTHD